MGEATGESYGTWLGKPITLDLSATTWVVTGNCGKNFHSVRVFLGVFHRKPYEIATQTKDWLQQLPSILGIHAERDQSLAHPPQNRVIQKGSCGMNIFIDENCV